MSADDLYKRGDTYWARIRDPKTGRKTRVSTGHKDRSLAREWVFTKQKEALAQADLKTTMPFTLDEGIELLTEQKQYEWSKETKKMNLRASRHLCRLFDPNKDLGTFEKVDFQAYVHKRREENQAKTYRAGDRTIEQEVVTLALVLRVAKEHHKINIDPESIIPDINFRYQPRERWLTLDEFKALVGVLPDHRKLWVQVSLHTGCRPSETEQLDWEDINWSTQMIKIRGTKTKASFREIPLHADLITLLEPLKRGATGLIVGRWHKGVRDLQRYCKQIGIPNINRNTLRHTFCAWALMDGVPIYVVSKLMGHSSSRMVEQVYGKLGLDSKREAMGRMRSTL